MKVPTEAEYQHALKSWKALTESAGMDLECSVDALIDALRRKAVVLDALRKRAAEKGSA